MADVVDVVPAAVDARDRDAAAAIARAAAGELLGREDIQAIFRIGKTRFYKLHRMHAFDQFRVHPPIGARCFSGRLITRYLAGDPVLADARLRRHG